MWAVIYDSDLAPMPMKTFGTQDEAARWLASYRRKYLKWAKGFMTPLGVERTKRHLKEDYHVHNTSTAPRTR